MQVKQLGLAEACGSRKDKLLNKACAFYALQLPLLSNWYKQNKV